MQTLTTADKVIFAITVLATAYFGFLALDDRVLTLDSVLLGVVRELLTIPLILAVAVVFLVAVVRLLRHRLPINPWRLGTAVALFVLNCLIWAV